MKTWKWIAGITVILLTCALVSVCLLGILAVPDRQTDKSILPAKTVRPTWTSAPTATPMPTVLPTATLEPMPTATLIPTATPDPNLIPPGVYLVGRDIQPGLYRGQAGDGVMESCYWARLGNLSGELGGIIANDNAVGQYYVEVQNGDFALETTCELRRD